MSKYSLLLIVSAFFISCSGDPATKFLGVWGEVEDYGYGHLVLISEKNDEIVVTSNWDDIGEGTFKAKIEGNSLSYMVKTRAGQLPVDMTFNQEANKLSVSTLNNEIVELENYNVKSLEAAVGIWLRPSWRVNGAQDSLIKTREDEDYNIKWVWQGDRVYKDKYFLKNSVCFANKESIDNIRYVIVKNDSILMSDAHGSIIDFEKAK